MLFVTLTLSDTLGLQAKNTFILALDGDTDFSPGSVAVLLDKMSNVKVAAVCGRIHPIGSGTARVQSIGTYGVLGRSIHFKRMLV